MIYDIIYQVISKSRQYELTDAKDIRDGIVQLTINNDRLWVKIRDSNNEFVVSGQDKNNVDKLERFIENGIREPIRTKSIEILDQGVQRWNEWRSKINKIKIDLSELTLKNISLSGIDFSNVDLSYSSFENVNFVEVNFYKSIMHETRLINCNCERSNLSNVEANLAVLTGSNFSYSKLNSAMFAGADLQSTLLQGIEFKNVNLKYADLTNSDLKGANLSGAIINIETNFDKAVGVKKGINGYWNSETDSAALFSDSPRGDSMKGPNIEAVLESLKRARKYFGLSFLLSLGAVMLWFLKHESTSIPFFTDFELTKSQYLVIGMMLSLGLLVLSKSFLDDAYEGMKYLETRKSAMAVGSFPWILTKFTGGKLDQQIISLMSRLVLCLHPLLYLFLLDYSGLNFIQIGLLIILTAIGVWILIYSYNFQKPILFDQNTEEKKSDENIIKKLDQINSSIKSSYRPTTKIGNS